MSIVNSVKGFVRTVLGIPPLTLPDCVDTESIINYTIDGNSIQDGTPTPEAPVEVESVGEYDEETGKYKIPVVCSGKNMFDKYNYTIAQGYYNDNGEHKPSADNSTWYIENYYPVYSGTYYRISGIKGRNGEPSAVYFYDKDKQWISRVRYSYAEVMSSGFTFKTPIECKFVRFQIHGNDTITENIFNKDIFMFELGTVTTDYEPYVEPVTTNIYLDEPLRKVGSVADTIDFENQKVIRRIKKWMFTEWDRSYGIDYYSDRMSASQTWTTCCIAIPFKNMAYGYSNKTVSHFKRGTNGQAFSWKTATHGIYSAHSENSRIYIDLGDNKSLYNSSNSISNWEYWNEAYVIGELAEPTETPITLPKLPTIKGTTIYSIDTAIQPTNMSATYYSTAKE